MATITSQSIYIEDINRMELYTTFTIPKVLEGLYNLLVKLGYLKEIPYGLSALFAVSMGILVYIRKFHQDKMPSSYLQQIGFLYGNSDRHIEMDKKAHKKEDLK